MSSRHLKKVYGKSQNDELKSKVNLPHSDDDEMVAGPVNQTKNFVQNPFELLNKGLDSGEENEDEEAVDQIADQEETKNEEEEIQWQTVAEKKKNKHKGKNKLKDGAKTMKIPPTSGPQLPPRSTKQILDNCREQVLTSNNLFSLDPKFLNPEYELKKIFGSKVINQELGKSGHTHRKCYRTLGRLITPRYKWPSLSTSVVSSGLSMTSLEPKELGFEYFKFEHDSHYRDVQKMFMRAVDSHDPDNILAIVRAHPYHIDSHIQLSDMSKQSEDSQVAAELIEIGLHTMELGMDSRFTVYTSNCRLEYKYQENRAFHILLYKHLTFISQRACHRTALELCKVLLNLDPTDQLCVTLMLDFHAIKAGECLWFTRVYNMWNGTKNLCQLPNWSYSVALAQFLLSIGAEGNNGVVSSSKKKKSNSENSLSVSEKEAYGKQSDELLQYSILMFPLVLISLLDKCGIQCDQRVRNHAYFNYTAQNSSTDALRLLCNLYVWRSHHLWKDPTILGWIEKNTHAAMVKIDNRDPIIHDFDQKRKRRYKEGTTPRNVIRHVLLTDEKELTVHIPGELSKEVIVSYDPLPPRDTVDIYQREEVEMRLAAEGGAPGILNAFLHSLGFDLNLGIGVDHPNQMHVHNRPNVENAERPAAAEEVEGNQGGTAATALHRSVNSFVEAMRNLLSVATGNLDQNLQQLESSDEDEADNVPPRLE